MAERLSEMRRDGRKALVGYFPLGDPEMGDPIERAKEFAKDGVDVLELGIPWHDPTADGQVVTESMRRALKVTSPRAALESVGEIRRGLPDGILQVMTYYGFIESMGVGEFARVCNEVGVDGVLSPDISPEQREQLTSSLAGYGIECLFFAPYHLDDEVVTTLREKSSGYVFLQAVDGRTGPRKDVSSQVEENISLLRSSGVTTPLYAGFGISSPDQVTRLMEMGADGVIVGSSIIESVESDTSRRYISSLRKALG